jgi:phage protein U
MAKVMLSLGGVKFHIAAVSYNELVRNWQWKWSGQARIGSYDALQYTGKANDKITLNGQVAALFKSVGTQQIQKLADLGDGEKPLLMVSGQGDVLGYWCVVSLSENNTSFAGGGLARQQTFTMELVYYGDDL